MPHWPCKFSRSFSWHSVALYPTWFGTFLPTEERKSQLSLIELILRIRSCLANMFRTQLWLLRDSGRARSEGGTWNIAQWAYTGVGWSGLITCLEFNLWGMKQKANDKLLQGLSRKNCLKTFFSKMATWSPTVRRIVHSNTLHRCCNAFFVVSKMQIIQSLIQLRFDLF